MDPIDEELISLGRSARPLPIGIAAVAVLLVIAVAKPWAGDATRDSEPTAPQAPMVATPTAAAGAPTSSPGPTPSDWDNTLCASPDGWLVVARHSELGRSVRTWLVASVVYSMVSPIRTSIPMNSLVSHAVEKLGFCAPAGASDHGRNTWNGTLWRQGGDPGEPTGWRQAARLTPSPGSLGAWADPLDRSVVGWPPGIYVMEARFSGSRQDAWLGLAIIEGQCGRATLEACNGRHRVRSALSAAPYITPLP
ncbi:MAG: hypothetical protein ACHQ01_07170 [Candidatus Limnocylindrales bacterium]